MYSKEIKEKVLNLLSQGKTAKKVQEILSEEDKVTISVPTIYSWKNKSKDISKEEPKSVNEDSGQETKQHKANEVDTSSEAPKPKKDIIGKRTFNSGKPIYNDKNIEMLVKASVEIKQLITRRLYERALSLCEKYTTEYFASKYPSSMAYLENQKLQALIGLQMYEKALELEEELEKKYPKNVGIFRIQKIKALINVLDIRKAKELSKKYEEEYPKDAKTFASLRLKANFSVGDYNAVLMEVDELIKKYGVDYFGSQKISALIGLKRYDEAVEISKTYENEIYANRKFKSAAIVASQKITALMKNQNYEEAEKEARIAIKKYYFSRGIFESQIITITLETKGIEEATRVIEEFKKQFPENSATYDCQLVTALINAKQYQKAIEKSQEFEQTYNNANGHKFATQRIQALTEMGKQDEAVKEAIESEKKYSIAGELFASKRLSILMEKNELARAKELARELLTKYPKKRPAWLIAIKKINDKIALEKSVTLEAKAVNEEIKTALLPENSSPKTRKTESANTLHSKPQVSLQKILEMSDEEFETYAKTLQNRETLFAIVARSKKQNQDKLAIGYIDMYLKKKENVDEALARQLKTMAKSKTPIFDEAKWNNVAKKFNLDFNNGAKTLLSQMIELAKQINNYPFDLQIDEETLLAVQQLAKVNLSQEHLGKGQKTEAER